MRPLLLLAVVIGNMIIPLWAARDASERRGWQKAVLLMIVLNTALAAGLRYIYWLL